jgi:hypothetical protein
MRLATLRPRLRRALSFSALAVILAFTSLTLSQCRMVTDRLTGVQPLNHRLDCAERCRDIYRISIIIENAIHQIRVHICHNNASCLATEQARHQAALARIEQNRINCLQDCHNQGGSDN